MAGKNPKYQFGTKYNPSPNGDGTVRRTYATISARIPPELRAKMPAKHYQQWLREAIALKIADDDAKLAEAQKHRP